MLQISTTVRAANPQDEMTPEETSPSTVVQLPTLNNEHKCLPLVDRCLKVGGIWLGCGLVSVIVIVSSYFICNSGSVSTDGYCEDFIYE